VHIKAMMEGINDIQKKFIQQNPDGSFKTVGEGDNTEWMYVPVYTDFKSAAIIADPSLIKQKFEEKMNEYMNTQLTLEL
jgi:hypothetical protein